MKKEGYRCKCRNCGKEGWSCDMIQVGGIFDRLISTDVLVCSKKCKKEYQSKSK